MNKNVTFRLFWSSR